MGKKRGNKPQNSDSIIFIPEKGRTEKNDTEREEEGKYEGEERIERERQTERKLDGAKERRERPSSSACV